MRTGFHLIFVWFGAITILLVLAAACAFTFSDFMDDRLYGTKRTMFILMLVAYAIYRAFRLKAALTRKNEKH